MKEFKSLQILSPVGSEFPRNVFLAVRSSESIILEFSDHNIAAYNYAQIEGMSACDHARCRKRQLAWR